MSFDLVDYGKLKGKLLQSILKLIEKGDKTVKVDDATDLDKLEDLLIKVSDDRRPQCRLILRSIKLLDEPTSPPDKARVLNALAYFIHQQIEASYTRTSPTNSTFYNDLTTSLALTKENMPDNLDLPDMYTALSKFLRSRIYISGDPRQGYLPKQEFKFPDPLYKIENDIKAIELKMSELRIINIDAASALHEKHQKSKNKSGGIGIFSSIFGSTAPSDTKKKPASKKASKKEVVVEEETQDTSNEVTNDSHYDEGERLVLK